MNREVMFSSDKNFWETPQKLFDELDAEFHFTLDAAASDENHKCARYFTQNDDGLRQNWGGAKQCFVTRPTGARKPVCGRRSVTAKDRNQGQRWCF